MISALARRSPGSRGIGKALVLEELDDEAWRHLQGAL